MKQFHISICSILFLISLLSACNRNTNNPELSNTDSSKTRIDSSKPKVDTLNRKENINAGHVQVWDIKPAQSKVGFTIKNFGSEVPGTLGGLKGIIHFDEKNLKSSSFEASVDVKTINTGNNMRNSDLMHEKYFDGTKYPQITFRSVSISKAASGYIADGNLTIKGKTLRTRLPFTFEQNGNAGTFKSQFTLQRLDYGIGGNGPIMGKDVNVSLEIATEKK